MYQGGKDVISIAVIEDHPLFRQGLCQVIEATPGMRVCGVAEDVVEGLQLIKTAKPTVAMIDIMLHKSCGFDLIKELRQQQIDVRVLVMSMYEEALYAEKALQSGARGYVAKGSHAERFLEAITQVSQGGFFLSKGLTEKLLQGSLVEGNIPSDNFLQELSSREIQVFHEIGRGSAVQEIARNLNLGITTVHTYRARIKEKLRLKDGNELSAYATRWIIEHGTI